LEIVLSRGTVEESIEILKKSSRKPNEPVIEICGIKRGDIKPLTLPTTPAR